MFSECAYLTRGPAGLLRQSAKTISSPRTQDRIAGNPAPLPIAVRDQVEIAQGVEHADLSAGRQPIARTAMSLGAVRLEDAV